MNWLKLRKEYVKAVYCHSAYLTYMQSTAHKMTGWMNRKLESRLPGEISPTSDMQIITTLMAESEELKSLLMKVNEESLVPSLHGRQMGKQWKHWLTVFFWASTSLQRGIAAMKLKDAHSLEGKMTNLDSILKSSDTTLPTKVHLVKAMVFPVVMYGCEN